MRTVFLTVTVAIAILFSPHPLIAAGNHAGGHGHGSSIGAPGDPANVSRTIHIVMTDNAFDPRTVSVKRGDTVRFVVTNKGEFVHEFNIGIAAMHTNHQKEMMAMMENGILETDRINHDAMKSSMGRGGSMMHDDPNSVLLEPRKSAEVVWHFDADADLEMACNVPGHYESGMVGKIHVSKH